MKYFFSLTIAFLKRFKYVILFSIILGLGAFFAIAKLLPRLTSFNATRIGITGRFSVDELPENITKKISKGLTSIADDGSAKEDLASWKTSDNGKTWIFTLKDNIYWQDGKKLVASDLNYDFSDVEVNYDSSKTITFKLKDPFVPFPTVLAKPIFRKGLLGLGEWKVKTVKLNGRYVQELDLQNAKGAKLVYLFYPTEDATKVAFELGKVNEIEGVLDPAPLDKWPTAQTEQIVDYGQVVTLFFNTQDKFLTDKSVRQALAYAIDKSVFQNRAISPVALTSWAYNPQVKEYPFDKPRALEILKDIPKDVLKNENLTITTNSILVDKADEISKNWKNIGINANVQVSDDVPTEFQVFLTILDIPDDPDQYPLWHSTQLTTNIAKYSNPRIDKLLEDGRSTENQEERKKVYLDFQRFLLEDSPAVFLYDPVYYRITRK